MPGKLPPGTVQWHTLPTRSTAASPSNYSPRAAIVQSVPKDDSAVLRPARATRPLGVAMSWCTTTAEGVTLVGAAMNVFLAALKLGAGMVAGSASLVADAGHSLSDLVTDAVCMLALRLRNERAEALCTLAIGAILCATGIGMSSAAGVALISLTRAGAARGAHLAMRGCDVAALVVAIFSVLSCAAPPPHLLACSLSSVSHAASASATSRHTPVTHPSNAPQQRTPVARHAPRCGHVGQRPARLLHAPLCCAAHRGQVPPPYPRPEPYPDQEGVALPHHPRRGHAPRRAHAGRQRLPPPLRRALVGRGHRRRGR